MSQNKFNIKDKTPEIYCAISILLNEYADIESFIKELEHINIFDCKICNPTTCPEFNINIAIVKYEKFWYLDDALTLMFAKVDHYLHELKSIVMKFNGEIYIDIAFYQYGTYPALVFSGENMKKIHFLDANISIDPY